MSRKKHRKPGKQRKSKIPAILIGLLILGLIAGAIGAKPLGRAFKATRAKSFVKEAIALKDEGKQGLAFERAKEAYKLSPENPEVMRLLGTMMKDNPQSHDSALYFLKELRAKGEATIDDKINLAGIYYAKGEQGEARNLLEEVESAAPVNAKAIELRSRLDGTKLPDSYIEPEHSPEDLEGMSNLEQLSLAKAQLRGRSNKLRTNALEILWSLSENKDRAALEALEILASNPPNLEKGRDLQEKLNSHPDSTDRHVLAGKSVEIKFDPTRSEKIIAEAVKERLGKPISELDDFLTWLLNENQSGWVLDLIPEETAKKSPKTLGFHMEALAREKQWEKLDLLLLDRELPINDSQRSLLQARCAIALNKPSDETRASLKSAMSESAQAGDFNAVASATQLAQVANFEEVTRLGLSILVTSPAWKENALHGYYKLATDDGDSVTMLKTAKDILKGNPNNEHFQQITAYLHLLEGTEIEMSTSTVDKLVSAAGAQPERSLLQSLAYLRMGRIDEATKICQSIDPVDLRAGSRAVYATILNRGGESIAAIKIAKKIPQPLLIDSELSMLNWMR